MAAFIWVGVVLTLMGVAGLVACVVLALRAKRSGLGPDAMRAALQRVVLLNLAAMGVSALGLGAVVFGLFVR